MESESATGFETDMVCCIESDMDHISGEIMGDAAGRLLQAGALDVSWIPVFMKKGRPGYRLSVLCNEEARQKIIDLIMLHTRTLGLRMQTMQRVIAQREFHDVQFLGSNVREKHCTYKNESFTKPEYGSLAALSAKTGKPVIELMEEYLKKQGR